MNEDIILSSRINNRIQTRLNKSNRAEFSIDNKAQSITNNIRSNKSFLNKSIDKKTDISRKKSAKSISITKSPKFSKKLYFIDEIIQLNKKLYFNQNDTKSRLKDVVGKKKNLTWNIENMCKKRDFNTYNKGLENYYEFLKKKVQNSKIIVEGFDQSNDLKSKIRTLKNNLEAVSSIGEEKRLYLENKLNAHKISFSNEAIKLNDMMSEFFPNLINNYHLSNFSEETIPLFFLKLKQNVEILHNSLEEKDFEIEKTIKEKEMLVNEIMYWKNKINKNKISQELNHMTNNNINSFSSKNNMENNYRVHDSQKINYNQNDKGRIFNDSYC